ncbi:MAG: sterol desaturase family protein [Saprospiraceae bacterium]
MEAYAQVLLYAIPGFVVLIIIEAIYAYFKGNFNFRSMDTISSLSSGNTNTLKSILGLSIVIISYSWVHSKVALVEIETTWLVYLLSFIAIDFASYWSHRLNHSINIFWNRHVVHHSSEEFNLAVALRQSISGFVSLGFIFLFPAALLGLPPKVIGVIAPLHLFMQFWYHTEHIGKLGWLEYIIVTPSQHRVHHAINPIYLDRNLSAIFCVWDRVFGTFQEELDEEPCVYGVTRQVNTWNPIKINFQHVWLLAKDAWRTNNFVDKLRIWFMPTGWRPADVLDKYPVPSSSPETFVKYDTEASTALTIWSWTQYLVMNALLIHILLKIADIPRVDIFIYGSFMFLVIYSFTTLMDRDPNAIWMEALKSLVGLGIIYSTGDWFLLDELVSGGTVFVAAYFVLSALVVGWFVVYEIGWAQNRSEIEEVRG